MCGPLLLPDDHDPFLKRDGGREGGREGEREGGEGEREGGGGMEKKGEGMGGRGKNETNHTAATGGEQYIPPAAPSIIPGKSNN